MPRDIPEDFTPENLDAVIAALQDECARLVQVREIMKELAVEKLPVKNSITLKKRGIPILISFVQAAVDSLRDYRLESKNVRQ